MSILDEICPLTVKAEAISLQLANPLVPARAFRAIDIAASYTKTSPEGVRLPLELLITGPSPKSFQRHFFRRSVPSIVTFTPKEGGLFNVVLREVGHNLWTGSLSITVAGEQLSAVSSGGT
jgi:hypothetical protein